MIYLRQILLLMFMFWLSTQAYNYVICINVYKYGHIIQSVGFVKRTYYTSVQLLQSLLFIETNCIIDEKCL